MIYPTNSVSQFYFVPAANAVVTKDTVNGKQFQIFEDSTKAKLIETTDEIRNILHTEEVDPDTDVTYRKGLLVAVKDGMLVKGQEYVLSLRISDFSQESPVVKAGSATGTTDAVDFYKALAISLILTARVDKGQLYELYDAKTGTAATDIVAANKLDVIGGVTKKAVVADGTTEGSFTKGFWIVEAQPDWAIATVPERLMEILVGTNEVLVDSELTTDWLSATVFGALTTVTSAKIVNTHKVADLEYFCKFEKGNKDGFANWPNGIKPELHIDATSTDGYALLVVHYAYVGAGVDNQKSERDAIFVATDAAAFAPIKTALDIE